MVRRCGLAGGTVCVIKDILQSWGGGINYAVQRSPNKKPARFFAHPLTRGFLQRVIEGRFKEIYCSSLGAGLESAIEFEIAELFHLMQCTSTNFTYNKLESRKCKVSRNIPRSNSRWAEGDEPRLNPGGARGDVGVGDRAGGDGGQLHFHYLFYLSTLR